MKKRVRESRGSSPRVSKGVSYESDALPNSRATAPILMRMKTGKISEAAANLFPGYFALVMATGIISIAAFQLSLKPVAWVLLVINVIAYVILWLLLLIRLIRFFPRVKADIMDHARGPGFFTVVAGTCVLGSELVIVLGKYRAAAILWIVGLLLWVLIMYTFLAAV